MLAGRARSVSIWPTAITIVVLSVAPAVFDGTALAALSLGLIYGIAAVGVDIFSGYGGRLTFGNFGFLAIGAYTSAILADQYSLSVWATLPVSVFAAAAVGFLLSIPVVKVEGLGAALVTFFFAFLVFQLLTGRTLAEWTRSADGIAIPTAHIFGTSLRDGWTLYYCCLAFTAVACVIGWRYATSRHGLALRVVKRSDVVAAANGIAVNRARRVAMTLSAGFAGAAGFLFAQAAGYLAPDSFGLQMSVVLFAMAVVGGLGSIVGPVYGAIFFTLVNQATLGTSKLAGLIFPAVLLIALVAFPEGIYGVLERLSVRVSGLRRAQRRSTSVADARQAGSPADTQRADRTEPTNPARSEAVELRINELSVRFGGVSALDRVSFTVSSKHVHGIMGPNGAGKTTLLNCISGIQSSNGTMLFDGREIKGLGVRGVRNAGVARTFQHPALVSDLTVFENVRIGASETGSIISLWGFLPLPAVRKANARSQQLAADALNLLDFNANRWHVPATDLSLAEQKIVDVARALAGQPRLLLLDEPTAGLDVAEMAAMSVALRNVHGTGIGIVVIAHHVDFLRGIADRLTVLDFGNVITSGSPDDVMADQRVIDVYLGASNV